MKPTLLFAFAALLSGLCSCASVTPPAPDPLPPPAPMPAIGQYVIHEVDENGKTLRRWDVDRYEHNFFPRWVKFRDATGQTVTLTDSFEIYLKQP